MNAIKGFQGEYRWLSNFYPCQIEFGGIVYPSTENAYQAAKFDSDLRYKFVNCPAGHAKRLARTMIPRQDWEASKYIVMYKVNWEKYKQPHFREMLLATGDAYIEETNTWGDTYWGVCHGIGDNHLGLMLMGIRRDIVEAVTT